MEGKKESKLDRGGEKEEREGGEREGEEREGEGETKFTFRLFIYD